MDVFISNPLEDQEYIWISDTCTDGYGGDPDYPDDPGSDCDCNCIGCDD